MDSQSFYRLEDGIDCNEIAMDRHLVINCTGLCVLPNHFTSHAPQGRNDYYFLYLCKGKLNMQVEGTMRPMLPGQAMVMYPKHEYRYQMMGEEEIRYYWVHFTGFGAASFLEECHVPCGKLLTIGSNDEIIRQIKQMFTDFIRRESWYQVAAASRFMTVLTIVGQCLTNATRKIGQLDRILTSLHFIHHHYTESLTLDALAAMEHLSVSRYRTVFRECMGTSPQSFIIDLRLRRACELMMQTDLPLKQIAQMAGYEDPLYFSRLFKEHFGMPPSQYKEGIRI